MTIGAFIVGAVLGLCGGWYLKGRFGAKVAADVAAVNDVAKKL